MGIFKSNSDIKPNLPNYLKIFLLIVTTSFLAFCIYWAVKAPFTLYDLVSLFSSPLFRNLTMNHPFAFPLIASQEFAATIALFVNLIAAILAFQCTILFIKNDQKWLKKLSQALLIEAFFFSLYIPTSIHHLVGTVLSMNTADVNVGLSFLLQVLLIAPPFIMLSYNLKRPQNHALIRKWISIAAPLFVFGFWFKYLFLWIDTLSPLGSKQASLASIIGAANSFLTLLIAFIATSIFCLVLYWKRRVTTSLAGVALIFFGSFFIIYDLVSIWVPVYRSFLYLTDFWMIVLPILGVAVLKVKSFNVNRADH